MKSFALKKILMLLCISVLLINTTSIVPSSQMQKPSKNDNIFSAERQNNTDSYYALIISGNYSSIDNAKDTIDFDDNAVDFYTALLEADNWDKHNIRLLIGEQASKESIQNSIKDWLDPLETKDDVILIYYIGTTYMIPHSDRHLGNTYSLTSDCDNTSFSNKMITDKEFDSWLDELDSDHITLVLDTEYVNHMHSLKQYKRTIIGQRAVCDLTPFKLNGKSFSVLSYFLISGLKGNTDKNLDEWISFKELFQYARKACLNYSIACIKESIRQGILQISIQIPFIYDFHFKETPFFSLSFGWQQLTTDGFGKSSNYATRGMEIFNGELYIGTQNNFLPNSVTERDKHTWCCAGLFYPDFYDWFGNLSRIPLRIIFHVATIASEGCELWKYNYSTDTLIKVIGKDSISGIGNGFNYHFNAAASVLKEFKGYLYVGTWNTPIGSVLHPERKGCEIWRSPDGIQWEQVVGDHAPYVQGGFGNPDNMGAWSIAEFNEYLYVGTMNWDFSDTGGCEVWRSSDGLHWEQVVADGFRPFMTEQEKEKSAVNTYAWVMQEYQGQLYMGTFNARLWLFDDTGTGGQLWRTTDGILWEKVRLPDGLSGGFKDGFGEGENYGIRRMIIYNDELYIGGASSFLHNHGCELWKYNGTKWTPLISDDNPLSNQHKYLSDGFGNPMNKYMWSMVVTSENKLWVGTMNCQVYTPLLFERGMEHELFDSATEGCEIWCFDGTNWKPIISNRGGFKPNGMGDAGNLGARSMIEYPENSGNIIVGTFKLFNPDPNLPREGCELWIRHAYNQ